MANNQVSLLGDDDSDDYPEDSFRVNKTFSGHYDTWRQKEEMQKLKDLKKDLSDTTSSESDSEEEPVIEKDFLKVCFGSLNRGGAFPDVAWNSGYFLSI